VKPKQPAGPAMTLGNMRGLDVLCMRTSVTLSGRHWPARLLHVGPAAIPRHVYSRCPLPRAVG
jgi:hypothetical protein